MYTKYDDLEKISSDVLRLGGLLLKHQVKLGNFGYDETDKSRQSYHKEYRYKSNQYSDKSTLISLKLSFSSFLTLEISRNNQANIFLNNGNIPRFVRVLKEFLSLYYDTENPIFVMRNNRLIHSRGSKDIKYSFESVNNLIFFSPYIDTNEEGQDIESVLITFPDDSIIVTVDVLETFLYHIERFDLYNAGLNMISYLGFPEEELGTIRCSEVEGTYNKQVNAFSTIKGKKRNIGDKDEEELL